MLFGFPTALKYRDVKNVPALFVVAFIILVIDGVVMLLRRRWVGGAV